MNLHEQIMFGHNDGVVRPICAVTRWPVEAAARNSLFRDMRRTWRIITPQLHAAVRDNIRDATP